MAQPKVSLDDLATQIFNGVDRDLKKTSQVAYIKDTGKTELGRSLSKLAAEIRETDYSEVSWDDVAEYRRNHGR